MRVVIIIHIGSYNTFNKMREYFNDIFLKHFDAYVNFVDDLINQEEQKEILQFLTPLFHYIKDFHFPNKGSDIGSFIAIIKYLIINNINYDILFKIHTKTNDKWRNELMIIMKKIKLIIKEFKKNHDLGIICSDKWLLKLDNLNQTFVEDFIQKYHINLKLKHSLNNHKSIYKFSPELIHCNNSIFNKLVFDYGFFSVYNNNHHNVAYKLIKTFNKSKIITNIDNIKEFADDIYFVAGTIFVMNFKMIKEFAIKYNIDISHEFKNMENGYIINDKDTWTHSWERILSGIIVASLKYKWKTDLMF
jgi:hypothetical protein